jgi:hypothetical protein
MPTGVRVTSYERNDIFRYTQLEPQTSEWIWDVIFDSNSERISLEYIKRLQALFRSNNEDAIVNCLVCSCTPVATNEDFS